MVQDGAFTVVKQVDGPYFPDPSSMRTSSTVQLQQTGDRGMVALLVCDAFNRTVYPSAKGLRLDIPWVSTSVKLSSFRRRAKAGYLSAAHCSVACSLPGCTLSPS